MPIDTPITPTLRHPAVLGAGPVGRAVVERLVAVGADPLVVTRSGTGVPGATARRADVSTAEAAISALDGATVVFQCAQPAYHRWTTEFRPLQDAVLAGCEAAGAALVAVENVYGYGHPSGPLSESTPLVDDGAPGVARKGLVRAEAWRDLQRAHEAGRVSTAAVRASDFFGPGVTESTFGARFFAPIVAGKRAQLFGPAHFRHSVTHVPDLAAALVAVAADPAHHGRAWHAPNALLDGDAPTVEQIVEIAATAAGTTARTTVVAPWMLRLAGVFDPGAREMVEMRYEFDRDFVVESTESESALALGPTPLDESITATVDWYRTR
jgi:nucleoside-diphosphate-sugar epimerase